MNENHETKSIAFMSEEEKKQIVRYTEDGEKLVYLGGDVWGPEPKEKTEEEKRQFEARYSHPKLYPWKIIMNI